MDASSSSNPDVPHITLVQESTCQFFYMVFEACITNRIPKLLIYDLYRAEHDAEAKLFKFNSYKFKEVAILGEVIIKQPFKNSYYFEVDDGTAQIRVYSTEYAETSLEVSHFDLSTCLTESQDLPENNINDIAKHLLLEEIHVGYCRAVPINITCGDIVFFMGNLSQYEEQRNLFLSIMYRVEENTGQCRLDWTNACLSSYHDNTSIYNTQWDEEYQIPE